MALPVRKTDLVLQRANLIAAGTVAEKQVEQEGHGDSPIVRRARTGIVNEILTIRQSEQRPLGDEPMTSLRRA
ncbi:hypothetical protein DMC47_26615 [Nostoc sp. 3335mG]|nr:hypothetical protein DMC47_26615 [Nostoc sp. 3335mG]